LNKFLRMLWRAIGPFSLIGFSILSDTCNYFYFIIFSSHHHHHPVPFLSQWSGFSFLSNDCENKKHLSTHRWTICKFMILRKSINDILC
jgi:hypothetical protein